MSRALTRSKSWTQRMPTRTTKSHSDSAGDRYRHRRRKTTRSRKAKTRASLERTQLVKLISSMLTWAINREANVWPCKSPKLRKRCNRHHQKGIIRTISPSILASPKSRSPCKAPYWNSQRLPSRISWQRKAISLTLQGASPHPSTLARWTSISLTTQTCPRSLN